MLGGTRAAILTPRRYLQIFSDLLSTTALPSHLTLSRSGNAMRYDSTGKLTYAPNNRLLQSATPTSGSWSKLNCSASGNTVSATSTSSGFFYQGFTLQSGTSHILSFDISATTAPYLKIDAGITTDTYAWFKTSDWTVGTVQAGLTAGIVNLGGGSYRLWVKFTAAGLAQNYSIATASADNTQTQVVGQSFTLTNCSLSAVTYESSPRDVDQVITTSAAYYGPRFDYDPSTLAAKGLLVEATATNKLTYSNTLTNAAWTLGSVGTPVQGVTSPDGTANGWTITASAATAEHRIYNSTGLTAGYSKSIYAKAGTASFISIGEGVSSNPYAVFNLSTGAISSSSGCTAAIESVGNGWYRCSIVAADTRQNLVINMGTSAANAVPQQTWAAAGTETVLLYGGQLEQNTLTTSYIPTTSASVARAAESLTAASYGTQPAVLQYRLRSDNSRARKALATYSSVSSETGEWLEKVAIYAPSTPSAVYNQYLTLDGQF